MKKLLLSSVFTVSSLAAFAQADNNTITLDLNKPTNPESFIFDPVKGYWVETFNDVDYTFFETQIFAISHLSGGPGSSWGGTYWDGFTVSSNGDNNNHGTNSSSGGWFNDQWGCMPGGGILTDKSGKIMIEDGVVVTSKGTPYIVGYAGSGTLECNQIIFNNGNLYDAHGLYVANHPWPYYVNIEGDDYARPLNQEGDYFKLIAHGLNSDFEEKGTVEFMLAEYKDGALVQSDKWEWMDLSALKGVAGIYFTLESTDSSQWGSNTPLYFCIDKLQVNSISTGIIQNSSDKALAYYQKSSDELIVNSPTSGYVSVYSVSGNLSMEYAVISGTNRISFNNIPQGIYVVKCADTTIKIIK